MSCHNNSTLHSLDLCEPCSHTKCFVYSVLTHDSAILCGAVRDMIRSLLHKPDQGILYLGIMACWPEETFKGKYVYSASMEKKIYQPEFHNFQLKQNKKKQKQTLTFRTQWFSSTKTIHKISSLLTISPNCHRANQATCYKLCQAMPMNTLLYTGYLSHSP